MSKLVATSVLILIIQAANSAPTELVCEGTQVYSVRVAQQQGFRQESKQRSIRLEFKFDEEAEMIWMRGHPRAKGQEGAWVAALKPKFREDYVDASFPLSLGKSFKISNLMSGNTGVSRRYKGRLDRVTGSWSTGSTLLPCRKKEERMF